MLNLPAMFATQYPALTRAAAVVVEAYAQVVASRRQVEKDRLALQKLLDAEG